MKFCIFNTATDPYFNLATEEYLLKNFENDIFMLWRNDRSVIVGKYQNSVAEINVDFVKERDIKVVRRLTGGGAVFHDLGNVNYTFIGQKGSGDFRSFSEPIIQALNKLGVPAKFEGRNDLTIAGSKFSGNAQCVYQNRILHHGTLLFASEMDDLSAALKVNPLKFKDKAVKSVRKRVTNIREHLPAPMSVTDFIAYVMEFVQTGANTETVPYTFTEADLAAICQLRDEKYATWEWNFGSSPQFDFSKSIRTAAGGTIEVNLSVSQGFITDFKLHGDFFSQKEISDLEQLFLQKPYKENMIEEILRSVELNEYLCNVTVDELMQLWREE